MPKEKTTRSTPQMRRLRANASLRAMVRETTLSEKNLIAPFFVVHGTRVRREISSMPGQFQLSVDQLLLEVERARRSGILAVLLFGIPKTKDALGREAYAPSGIVQQAIQRIKKEFPEMIVMSDLCFCEYTDHGHCGVLSRSGDVDNDKTLSLIAKTAVAQARAGADFVAPSGMMDGAVAVIRAALDKANFKKTGILAYSAKYASVFYGPFRDAADSAPQFGDRKTYQMDSGNSREAIREVLQDVREGADMVMVKPALSYLDVIAKVRPAVPVPLVAYNVSGEYAMVKAAEKMKWLDGQNHRTAIEVLTAIRRAGADLIITYHALEVAAALKKIGRS